jgi:uncharacterized membrane protein (GlpM family)
VDLVYRFLVGGLIVSVFATIADVVKPRTFAGLFGAAPSVALATLTLTMFADGKSYAAVEARSMIAGAAAFLIYAAACVYLMSRKHARAGPTAVAMWGCWGVAALVLWLLFLRQST